MANDNPILFIHDVGAGGLSNAIPELVHDTSTGGNFELRDNDNAGSRSRSNFLASLPSPVLSRGQQTVKASLETLYFSRYIVTLVRLSNAVLTLISVQLLRRSGAMRRRKDMFYPSPVRNSVRSSHWRTASDASFRS